MAVKLYIYRAGALLTTIDIDKNAVLNDTVQVGRKITCPISAKQVLTLQPDDYITFDGEKFTINILPDIEQDGAVLADKYDIVFEAELYRLLDKYVKSSLGKRQFSYYGTPKEHLQQLITSAGDGWSLGTVDTAEAKVIDYDYTYISAALNTIAEAFSLEWSATGKVITMVASVGRNTSIVFELGRSKGLRQLKRTSDTSKQVVNRVFAEGGSKNITSKYRDGTYTTLTIDGDYVEAPEVTSGKERVKEGRYINDKIFPQFIGTVTGVTITKDSAGVITSAVIKDTSIDFDLNLQLQEGVTAKMSFLSGPLMGAEFEISKYVHSTRSVTIIPSKDANGYVLPNDLNLPAVGHKYTFYDIIMPATYVTNAQNKLLAEAKTFLAENRYQRLLFAAKPDMKFLRDNNIRLKAGDKATIKNTKIGVNDILRFTEISFPVCDPYDVTAVLGSEIRYDALVKMYADTLQNTKQISVVDRKTSDLAKRSTANLRELESSIFATDGTFDSAKMNIGVLTAALGIYGVRSQNFLLSGVYITDNYGGNANAINITAGELIHMEISNSGNKNIWQMQTLTQSGLTPASRYYVYSKCSKTNQVGSFVISTDQILPEAIDGYYMFLTGLIYPVLNGTRDSEFTNGITSINGNRIKTGKIESPSGELVINLLTSEIFGKVSFKSATGTTKNLTDVDTTATAAKTTIDNLSIGGRNYIRNSNFANTTAYWSAYGSATVEVINGKLRVTATAANVTFGVNFSGLSSLINFSTEYTFSGRVTTSIATTYGVYIAGSTGVAIAANTPNQFAKTGSTTTTSKLIAFLVSSVNVGDYFELELVKFESGNKATDWTLAPEDVQANITTAQTTATNAANAVTLAQLAADKANNAIADIANDDLLIPSEKQEVLKEWQIIEGEKPTITAQAGTYAISTSSYDSAYSSLNTYITPLLNDLTTKSTIAGITFRSTFKAYYDAKTALLKLISDKAKSLADTAQSTADGAATAASNAAAAAKKANDALADISNDDLLVPSEKQDVLKEWQAIQGAYSVHISQAGVYGVSTADYISKYNTLNTYITPLLSSLTTNSTIVGSTFRANFNNFYVSRDSLLSAISTAAKALVDNIKVGGRNYFRNSNFAATTAYWSAYGSATVQILNGKLRVTATAAGVTFGVNLTSTALAALINFSTEYTFSGRLTTSIATTYGVYIASSTGGSISANTPTQITKTGSTSSNSKLIAVLITSTSVGDYFDLEYIKLESGNKATDWTLSPEDTDASISAAQTTATNAATAASNAAVDAKKSNDLLADISSDNKLVAVEKHSVLQEVNVIKAEYPVIKAQSDTYSLVSTTYTAAYNALISYTTPLLADLGSTSDVVGATFRQYFATYYTEKQTLLKAISDAAKAIADANTKLINGKTYASGRMLYRDVEFANGLNGIVGYNNSNNGNVVLTRVQGSSLPNGSGWYISIQNKGAASPGFGGFTFNTQSRANAKYIVRILAQIPAGYSIEWGSNPNGTGGGVVWNTPVAGTGKWEEYICTVTCGSTGTFSTTNYFFLSGSGATGFSWSVASATVYDMTAAEYDFKALSDQANQALSALQNDTAAFRSAYDAFTAKIKDMAFQDVVEFAKLGSTVIDGGYVRTNLLNVNAIWANIINAGYITASQIEALNITAKTLAAVSGTIGGFKVSDNSIYSENGLFSINKDGGMKSTKAEISGDITIGTQAGSVGDNQFTRGWKLSGSAILSDGYSYNASDYGNNFALVRGTSRYTGDKYNEFAFGTELVPASTGGSLSQTAYIRNNRPKTGSTTNVALEVSATGADKNIALNIPNGGIQVGGSPGYTGTVSSSSPFVLTIKNGIIVSVY